MKKNFLSILITLVLVFSFSLVANSVWAYYTGVRDTETSGVNTVQSEVVDIDLEMSVDNVTSGVFTFIGILPGKDLDSVVIELRNIGQSNGYLYQRISYVEADESGGHSPNLTPDEFAALIYVESIMYQHFAIGYPEGGNPKDDMAGLMEIDQYVGNSDGYCSLYEMKKFGWMPYDIEGETDPDPKHTLKVGEAGAWTIVFHMADSLVGHEWGVTPEPVGALNFDVLDDAPQADGINITWEAILSSVPTFTNLP